MSASAPRASRPRSYAVDETDDRGGPRLTPLNLFLVLVAFWLMTQVGSLLVSLLMALLLGTVLEFPVSRLQARGIPRAAAIAFCYVGVVAAIAALIFLIVPIVDDQASSFREEIPGRLNSLEDTWSDSSNPLLSGPGVQVIRSAQDFLDGPDSNGGTSGDAATAATAAIPVIGTVVGGLTSAITTLVITFYYLLEKSLVRRLILGQLNDPLRTKVDHLWTEVESKVGGWLRGQLLLCLIIGSIATISYGLIGISFWPLLGLWAGITEIIPIVGPWLGGIPAVLVALTMGFDKALIVVAVIVCMQSLENWFLVPRVMRGAVGLTPMSVFIGILAGTELMGVIGAILAIPIAAGLQVILTDYLDSRRSHRSAEQPFQSGWRWMMNRGRDVPEPAVHQDEWAEGQAVSQVYDGDPETDDSALQPEMAEDAVAEDSAMSTWPANPWKGRGQTPRRTSTWSGVNRDQARPHVATGGDPSDQDETKREKGTRS